MSPPDFKPHDPEFAANPYPAYARLRASQPILVCPELGMALFFTYGHILSLLTDKRFGRTLDHTRTSEEIAAQRRRDNWQALPSYSRYVRINLLETEGADHARIRRVLLHALGPTRIRTLQDTVKKVSAQLLLALPDSGEIDFIGQLAEPLPVRVIADLLGWPENAQHRLRPWSAAITRLYEPDHSPQDAQRAEHATREFAALLNALAEQRRRKPRDDLVSTLVMTEHEANGLSRDEVIATCMMLLNAGHEATVNGAGNGLLALLRHPEALAKLRTHPHLMPGAVEEMLRYDAPLHLFHRFVVEDLTVANVKFRRGDKIGLLYGSANRDPQVFSDAERFLIERSPNRHLAFGAGTHFCVGAPLARLELTTLFTALLDRFAHIQLTEDGLTYHGGLVFRGLKQLRIAVTA